MTHLYTLGPWAVNPFIAEVDSAQVDDAGDLIPVCRMLWPTDLRSEEETDANAHLIAAAPDLLVALVEFSREYDGFLDGDGEPCPTLAKARAAIGKATGQQVTA